jgi:2-polyprenyl-3-methyl-5-hydroxy-6-metoxy-1,4-benzoquinol methylase
MLTRDRHRAFFRCARCELIFADPESHLNPVEEKARYDQHQNDPADARYRRFLNQLAEPLLARLMPGMQGLDYGCGPGPTLSVMLQEAGMEMQLYDPYYAPKTSVLDRKYDFVTCTEAVEHFYQPDKDWARLVSLLRRDSSLGVMTRIYNAADDFDQWYYKNDPTHVNFYSPTTLAWLAAQYDLMIDYCTHNVVLFTKS